MSGPPDPTKYTVPGDGIEESTVETTYYALKVMMLLDNKMGLHKNDVVKLTQLKLSTVCLSILRGFTVTKLIWMEDDCPEPTLRTQHKDEGGDEEDTCSAKELDTAPTLRPPGEPHPPPQRYFMHSNEDK